MSTEELAMVAAVAKEEDQVPTPEVTLFRPGATDHRLDIVDMRFALDHRIERGVKDEAICASKVGQASASGPRS
jgi:hypothetical protein